MARKAARMARRSSGRERSGRHGRHVKSMPRSKRVLVVTNGKETEPQYCDLLNETARSRPREQQGFHITCKSNPIDPANLAEYALKLVKRDRVACEKKAGGVSDPFDLVFVVVDVDDYLRENPKSLREAQKTCEQNNMRLVISNPCFEVWLIDHVMVCPSHVTTQGVAEDLAKSKGLTTGRDNKYLVPERLRGRVGTAVGNAAAHNGSAAAVHRKSLHGPGFAPWADFPELIKAVGAS